jgi:hypothetical protein
MPEVTVLMLDPDTEAELCTLVVRGDQDEETIGAEVLAAVRLRVECGGGATVCRSQGFE